MSPLIPSLIEVIRHYGYWFVFFGAIVGGEAVILAAVFLGFLGIINIYLVISLCLFGTIISDNIWYVIGFRSQKLFDRLINFCLSARRRKKLDSHFKNHHGKLMLLSKFIYGTRIFTLLTFGQQRVYYRKFFWFNLISTMVWLGLLIFGGYILSFSWNQLDEYRSYVRYLIIVVLMLIIIARFLFKKVFEIWSDYEPRNR